MNKSTILLLFVGVLASTMKTTEAEISEHWDRCQLPSKDEFMCSRQYLQWGLNKRDNKCVSYTWAMCKSYDSGYRTEEECKRACIVNQEPESPKTYGSIPDPSSDELEVVTTESSSPSKPKFWDMFPDIDVD